MKLWELEQNHFNRYEDIDGRIWQYTIGGSFIDETGNDITDIHTWRQIHTMEFELCDCIDWKTVAVDTPIYVRENPSDEWQKRHFSSFKDGKIYVFSHGMTSWTADPKHVVDYKNAKLL